ncbi:TPA: hypothetical protein DEP86_00960 [Candidatus Uhrbacteria bacterium]|nr:hypothetical protein [Candidatus Uhrbacteria bacterium]
MFKFGLNRRNRVNDDSRMILGIDASRANCSRRTGVEWYAYHVIQRLKKIVPADVRVVLYSRESLIDGLEQLPANWESRVLLWSPLYLWTQLRLSWEMLVNPPDVLYVPAHVLPPIRPHRSITTLHDVAFVTMSKAYSWYGRAFLILFTWLAVRWADALVTVSDFSKSEIVRLFHVDPSKILVAPLACDPEIFRPDFDSVDTSQCLTKLGIKSPYFLFVGRLEQKKNLSLLLAAFSLVRERLNCRLVLAGKRGRGFEDEFIALDRRWVDEVVELGYVDSIDLPYLYAGAEALVFPSRYEGFGIPILESFASGIPVVTLRSTSIPEVAGEAAFYAESTTAEALAETMLAVRNDVELHQHLVSAGLERSREFSWERTTQGVWRAIESFLRH